MTDKVETIENSQFDILVLVGPNETFGFDIRLHHIKHFIQGYRNIYIICHIPNAQIEGCISVNEDVFPFTKETVKKYFSESYAKWRGAWYFQQLMKLYAGYCIPGILDKYLVIDADILLLKPMQFIQDNKFMFNYSNEYHYPYFNHMTRMHPSLTRQTEHSGITHHMMFYIPFMTKLFELVETYRGGKPFWQIFMESVYEEEGTSGASEYEIYFNFVLKYYPEHVMLRPLDWTNIKNYDYVSVCNWMGRPAPSHTS